MNYSIPNRDRLWETTHKFCSSVIMIAITQIRSETEHSFHEWVMRWKPKRNVVHYIFKRFNQFRNETTDNGTITLLVCDCNVLSCNFDQRLNFASMKEQRESPYIITCYGHGLIYGSFISRPTSLFPWRCRLILGYTVNTYQTSFLVMCTLCLIMLMLCPIGTSSRRKCWFRILELISEAVSSYLP